MSDKIRGLIYVAMCYILVGSSYPIAKEAMDSIPTWTFTCITFLVAIVCLFPLSIGYEKTRWSSVSRKDWLFVSIISLLGAVLYTVFLLYGIPSTSAVSASVISSTTPAVVLVLSILIFKEKFRLNVGISVALAVISVVVMTLSGASGPGSSTLGGVVFLCLSTLSNSLNILFANKLTTSLKPLSLATGVCITGAIFSLPMCLIELKSYNLSLVTAHQLGIIVYYGVFVWALPYLFFFRGINKISASSAGMCVALIPVASLVASVVIYGDKVRMSDAVATLVIIFSVLFSEINIKGIFKRTAAKVQL